MAHVWGKNEGRVGKLATNIHIINSVLRGEIPTTEIGIESIKAAIAFTEFYTLQVQAIYSQLSGLLEDSNSRSYSQQIIPSHLAKVLEVAARKGDWITSREVIHSLSSKQQKTAKADVVRSWFVSLSQMDKGILDGDGRKLRFKATVSNSVSSFVSQSKSSQSNDSNSIVSNVINVSDTQNQFTIHNSQFTIEEVPQGLERAASSVAAGESLIPTSDFRLPTSFEESAKDANNANKVNESHEEQVFEGANNTTNKAANKLETANKEYDLKLHIGDRVRDFFTNWCGTVLELMPDRARIRWDYDRRVTDRL
jgi:hypothetical protein